MHQRNCRQQIACPKEDIEDFVLPDSDRCIYSIEKIDAEPLAVKNARLFMNKPQTITKIASLSSQSIPISSISPLRVRSQISPGLVQQAKEKKRNPKILFLKRDLVHNLQEFQKDQIFKIDLRDQVLRKEFLLIQIPSNIVIVRCLDKSRRERKIQ